ncbi:MarR family transcriptional regulator [Streptomyces sp. Da 82-17]|uniref:MarR family transcriptional regulator n=1 Tax=Streptomyces sp. Da 82-17 TaxID=3377116 RepID=UPI0038D4D23B
MSRAERESRLGALEQELRNLTTSSVFFHQAVADQLKMSVLDLNCLNALVTQGPMTAGRLTEVNGVTTGAITGVVDRLEKAGFVRRDRDPNDRRRVIVTPLPNLEAQIFPLFAGLSEALSELAEKYSDEELAVIVDFVRAAGPITHEQIARLRADRKGGSRGKK